MAQVTLTPRSAAETLDREFLGLRGKILEIAATLDRIDRGGGSVADDPRVAQLRRGLELLASPGPSRAEEIQMVFSLPYDPQWRAKHEGRAAASE
jgi:hypothetical protein